MADTQVAHTHTPTHTLLWTPLPCKLKTSTSLRPFLSVTRCVSGEEGDREEEEEEEGGEEGQRVNNKWTQSSERLQYKHRVKIGLWLWVGRDLSSQVGAVLVRKIVFFFFLLMIHLFKSFFCATLSTVSADLFQQDSRDLTGEVAAS